MATASKRIPRKELRQPDWFETTTLHAYEWMRRHRAKLLAGLAGLAIIALVVLGWQIFRARQNEAASREFAQAVADYQDKKYQEAIAGFQKVQQYRWSRYSSLGYLYEANSHLSLNDPEKAAAPAARYLTATGPDTIFRQMALMTLANIEERQKNFKQALQRYAEAENINGPYQREASLGKARAAENAGDLSAAIAGYKDFVNKNPESTWATLKLAELEAKAAQQKTAK